MDKQRDSHRIFNASLVLLVFGGAWLGYVLGVGYVGDGEVQVEMLRAGTGCWDFCWQKSGWLHV